ncbi:hypothetical protein KDJ21_007130 [Metabacillus litoralis]|uniref:hypothetical protein n=1 Tax=Metabacillus litoralis TaxID=152268 RepID=UPI001BA3B506|nr:hypothetical protein [Metabacillus litoralis]UHA61423.1 hypothetical protein KDJ21_007130 [Metabacillus litoralis]
MRENKQSKVYTIEEFWGVAVSPLGEFLNVTFMERSDQTNDEISDSFKKRYQGYILVDCGRGERPEFISRLPYANI